MRKFWILNFFFFFFFERMNLEFDLSKINNVIQAAHTREASRKLKGKRWELPALPVGTSLRSILASPNVFRSLKLQSFVCYNLYIFFSSQLKHVITKILNFLTIKIQKPTSINTVKSLFLWFYWIPICYFLNSITH